MSKKTSELRKFVWVGYNKKFKDYMVSQPMTTEDILLKNYPSFFSLDNRQESGNCKFIMEVFEGDSLIYYTKNSMSSMSVELKDGCFIGVGPFNSHPLEVYFDSPDFENMEIELTNP